MKLNPSQVLILQTLVKHPGGMTIERIMDEVKDASVSPINLGPTFLELLKKDEYKNSLYARGLVRLKRLEEDGKDVHLWFATAKGEKVASTTKAQARLKSVIPTNVLDPVARKFSLTRTYSFEQYTEEDIGEVRKLLGKAYHDVPTDTLRKQLVNRRKQNAFSSPEQRRIRPVKTTLAAFGPYGKVEPYFLTNEQIERLQEMLKS